MVKIWHLDRFRWKIGFRLDKSTASQQLREGFKQDLYRILTGFRQDLHQVKTRNEIGFRRDLNRIYVGFTQESLGTNQVSKSYVNPM